MKIQPLHINYYNCYNNQVSNRQIGFGAKPYAVCGGCFDPFTNGHLNYIKAAVKIFGDKFTTVLLTKNPNKKNSFLPFETRIKLIRKALDDADLKKVKLVCNEDFNSFLTKHQPKHQNTVWVRGVRNVTDYQYEDTFARQVQEQHPNISIIYTPTIDKPQDISSSRVKAQLQKNEDVKDLIPKNVFDFLSKNK